MSASILDVRVPRNITALMQHLQRLVGREGCRHWCGGRIRRAKLAEFVERMARRYPALTRSARQRSYDRSLGRAVMHMIVYTDVCAGARAPSDAVMWWIVSTAGDGGLRDPASEDAKVAADAMSREGHIEALDYVLMYASKKEQRQLRDGDTGVTRTFWKQTSTWTWRISSTTMREVEASIDACCAADDLGHDTMAAGGVAGLRGILWCQRQRPLFSGVRSQVLHLHRYAIGAWGERHRRQRSRDLEQPDTAETDRAPALAPLSQIAAKHLPKMRLLPVYDRPPIHVRDLLLDPTAQ